jgi:hypothetical protein
MAGAVKKEIQDCFLFSFFFDVPSMGHLALTRAL